MKPLNMKRSKKTSLQSISSKLQQRPQTLLQSCLHRVGEALDIHNLDREPGKIFITDGTGVIGHRMIQKLVVQAGYTNVRFGTSYHIHDIDMMGAEIADFAWHREETYDNALSGVKSVFITIPYEKNWYKHYPAFLKACKKARVKHYVKLSYYLSEKHINDETATYHHIVPFIKRHAYADELLQKMIIPDIEHVSHMSYTILYASHYMSNPIIHHITELHSSTTASTSMYGLSCHKQSNYVSPNDIVDVGVRVLLSPHVHYNRTYTLTGPQIVSKYDIARIVSKHLGKECTCTELYLSELKHMLQNSGMPDWNMKDLIGMEHIVASGIEELPSVWNSNDIERICGHAPESYSRYISRTEVMCPLELGHQYHREPILETPVYTKPCYIWNL